MPPQETLTHRLSLLWAHCYFPLGPQCTQGFVCALQESLFSPVLWKFCNQIPLSFKVRFSGDSQFLCWIPRLESDVGPRNFTTVWGHVWYFCSPVCGSPTWWVWNLMLTWLCPSYCLIVASFLSLDMDYLFLVGSNILQLMVVQQLVKILVLLWEKMKHILLLHCLGTKKAIIPQTRGWKSQSKKANPNDDMDHSLR